MEFQAIPFKVIFLLLIEAAWIFGLFALLQHIVIRMIKREGWHDWLAFYVPLIRNVSWILFSIKVIYTFGSFQPLLVIAISGVVLALTWSIIRDFVLGTIFRFQKGNIVLQEIKINEYKGQVVKMGETKLSLELKNGEIVQLPYKSLFTEVLIKPISNKQIKAETIVVPINEIKSIELIKKQIKSIVLASPWVVFKNGVSVELFNDTEENQKKIKVSYSISVPSKSLFIQEELRTFISENSK